MPSVSPSISKLRNNYSYTCRHLQNLLFRDFSSFSTSHDHKTRLDLLLQGNVSSPHLLQIHAQILRFGVDQDNLIATRLIGHYPPQFALRVFHQLHKPNVFPFNAITSVLSKQRLFLYAISVFKTMKFRSVSPNDLTFSFLLKACFQSNNAQNVQQIHTHIFKSGFDCNSSVRNGLLATYAKGMKDLASAHRLFDEMPDKRIVFCWTCLIDGYAHSGQFQEVLTLFVRMIKENVKPEDDAMVKVLSACSSLNIGETEKWEKIFVELSSPTDIDKDLHCGSIYTILVYLYGKGGKIDTSRKLFDKIIDGEEGRSVFPWNAMIGGYVQNGRDIEALSLFKLMVGGGPYPKPNHVTMVSVLSACAQVGDLDLGKWVHEYLKTSRLKGYIESNTLLATALIDMYSKCGKMQTAREIFDRMIVKDVVSFNAMITGLAINGQAEEALRLFSKLKDFGVNPNGGTFLGVLSACNHSGMVGEGRQIFLDMVQRYSCTPRVEHYACYIDLLARGGHVEEALEVVASMPAEPNGIVLGAVLQGCLTHTRLDLAEDVAAKLIKVAPVDSAGYVMLSNVYASDHNWSEISHLRGSMRERRVRKQPGCSWIGIGCMMHEFLVGSFIINSQATTEN